MFAANRQRKVSPLSGNLSQTNPTSEWRHPTGIDLKQGHHFLQAHFSLPM
jgi:hypothetical protein